MPGPVAEFVEYQRWRTKLGALIGGDGLAEVEAKIQHLPTREKTEVVANEWNYQDALTELKAEQAAYAAEYAIETMPLPGFEEGAPVQSARVSLIDESIKSWQAAFSETSDESYMDRGKYRAAISMAETIKAAVVSGQTVSIDDMHRQLVGAEPDASDWQVADEATACVNGLAFQLRATGYRFVDDWRKMERDQSMTDEQRGIAAMRYNLRSLSGYNLTAARPSDSLSEQLADLNRRQSDVTELATLMHRGIGEGRIPDGVTEYHYPNQFSVSEEFRAGMKTAVTDWLRRQTNEIGLQVQKLSVLEQSEEVGMGW